MLLARNTVLFKTRNVSYANLLNYVLCMSTDVFKYHVCNTAIMDL